MGKRMREKERERNVNNILFTKRYTRSAGGLRFCEIKARIFCVTQISTEKWVTRERDCKLRGTSNDRTNERASERTNEQMKKKSRTERKRGSVRKGPVVNCKCPVGHEQKNKRRQNDAPRVHESLSRRNVDPPRGRPVLANASEKEQHF